MTPIYLILVLLQSFITCTVSKQHQEPTTNSHDNLDRTDSATNTDRLLLDMHDKMSAFHDQMERQSETMVRQAESLARQELLVQTQRQQIEELQQLVTTQQETINNHAKQMITQKKLTKQLARTLKQVLDQLNSRTREKTNVTSRISRQVEEGGIAFSAYLNANLVNIAPGHIIKMSGITLNEGHAYNPSNGIFTTPRDGVYLFSFAMEDYRVHQLRVALVVDGAISSMVATEPFHMGQNLQGTNVVILRLTTGQQVWTTVDQADSPDSIEGSSRWKVSTFSGVFLYA